jgi:hypothetical protein
MLGVLRAENIFDVARPLHRISRCFGLTAFAIHKNEGRVWKARITLLNFIGVLVLSAYLLSLSVYFVIHFDKLMFFDELKIKITKVIRIATILVTVTFILTTAIISVITLITRHSIVRVFNIIAEFDEEILNLGIRHNHKKDKILVISIFAGWTLFSSSAIITSIYLNKLFDGFHVDPILFLSIVFCINSVLLFEFQFISVLVSIKVRFRELNRFLWLNFNSTSPYQDDRTKIKILNMTARLHEMLVFASEAVNEGFGVAVSGLNRNIAKIC